MTIKPLSIPARNMRKNDLWIAATASVYDREFITTSKDFHHHHKTKSIMEYTKKQGQYLAFIYYYKKLNKVAPAHMDFQRYFETNPASVNGMLKTLAKKGFIEKEPGKARSIVLLLERAALPDLD